MRESEGPPRLTALHRVSRRGVGVLALMLLGEQTAISNWQHCPDPNGRRTPSAASSIPDGQHMMHHVPDPSSAPAHRAGCDHFSMAGACDGCVVLAPSVATTLAPAPVIASHLAIATHVRPSSLDITPDIPPPRA